MSEFLAPGVYPVEYNFRAPSIQGVGTSTTGFVGPTRKGPLGELPEVLTSFADFERLYGGLADLLHDGEDPRTNLLAYAVRGFFNEGGSRLFVARAFARPPGAPDDWGHARLGLAGSSAALRARTPGSALNGSMILRERLVPARRASLDQAPIGTIARAGGSAIAGAAVLRGSRPPFALANGDALRLRIGADEHEVTVNGTAASIAADDPLADPLDLAADLVFAITVGDQEQAVTIPAGNYAREEMALVLNGLIRFAAIGLDAAGHLVIASDARGSGAHVALAAAVAELGFTAAAADDGTGNVADLDRVGLAELATLLAGLPIAIGTDAESGDLVLTTTALGTDARLEALAAPAALGLPLNAPAEGSPGATPRYWRKSGASAWDAEAGAPAIDLDAADLDIVQLDVEMRDEERETIVAYEGLGLDPEHPNALGTVLARNPTRRSDALANPYFFQHGDAGALALRALLFTGAVRDAEGRLVATHTIGGGHDGLVPGIGAYQAALAVLDQIDDIAIVAAPGSSALDETDMSAVQRALVGHAEASRYRIAVLDPPVGATVMGVRGLRGGIDSTYAALYWPWIVIANPRAQPGDDRIPKELALPPSGHICGIYARNDGARGVHKAPANEVVREALRFEREVAHGEQEILNPIGVNCLRYFMGRGYRVWGARLATSDRLVVYVSDRRYLNYLKRSIFVSSQWAVFEPNGPRLWANIRDMVWDFLYAEWRGGALLGPTPDLAFFVRCDRSTMSQADLDNGRLICEVGVALVKPAEFVIFRIGQKTADSRG